MGEMLERCEFDFTDCELPVREVVEPLVGEVAWLIPPWCRRLCVHYRIDENVLVQATMIVSMNYRVGELAIYPAFLAVERRRQLEVLYHELFHLVCGPLLRFRQALDVAWPEDGPAKRIMLKANDDGREEAASDFASLMVGQFHSGA